jgi:two-component system heavy metal sensor histidine kinase CusS
LLAAPRFDLDADAAFLTRAMLLVWLVAVGWAMLVTTWIVRRLTRGHESIAEVARRVAKGDLSARIPDRASGPEMAQLAHDVNRMIERLSSLLTSQKEFIAHAAHELRSPLTALYGELSHALRRLRDAESYQHSIEEALDSTRRLKLLAEELLTLARLDATVDAARETVEPSRILQGAVRSVARCAEERGVAIVVEGETSARPIRGRAQDLERLFRNLLENAIRHSPPGGSIKVLLVDEPGGPFITVSDEGSGVKDADRDLIFEPFYRGSATRADDESGVGLGLAIARRIARAHGGDISLAAPGGALAGSGAAPGAQFIVRLRRDGE